MNKWLLLVVIGISGLMVSCDSEKDKIREEIEHIASTPECEEGS